MGLTAKQEKFCAEYIIDKNATAAAARAGYSKKTADKQGWELLQNPKVKARIEELLHEAMIRCELSADMVIKELQAMAFFSIRDFVDEGNTIKDLTTLSREKLKPVTGIKVTEKVDSEGYLLTVTELKLADKRASLVDLGRHLGIFKEDNEQGAIKIKVTRK